MRDKFIQEIRALRTLTTGTIHSHRTAPVSEDDLAPFPDTVWRYLRFMRVTGRPRDWSFRLRFTGRFRRSRDDNWMKCESWQFNASQPVVRIFYIQLRFFGLLPVLARDTYIDGRGRMLIRLLDRFTVGDGTGEAYDLGELVTYLNDAILLAPSMLLVPQVRWHEVDSTSFDIELADHGRTVKARVHLDERGAPICFETTDRFYSDPKDASLVTRCRWTTPVDDFQDLGDRRIPTRARAVWHPLDGEFAYADFSPDLETLAFNTDPRT